MCSQRNGIFIWWNLRIWILLISLKACKNLLSQPEGAAHPPEEFHYVFQREFYWLMTHESPSPAFRSLLSPTGKHFQRNTEFSSFFGTKTVKTEHLELQHQQLQSQNLKSLVKMYSIPFCVQWNQNLTPFSGWISDKLVNKQKWFKIIDPTRITAKKNCDFSANLIKMLDSVQLKVSSFKPWDA